MPRRPAAIGLVLGLTLLGVAPALPAAAAGLTLNVTTTADTDPASGPCQSGATAPPNPSSLSLRDATCIANNAGGTATISVPAGTYQLSHGELQIGTKAGQDVTLAGAGAGSTTIDAQGQSRVLDFDPKILGGVTGDVQGVTITGGNDSQYGGAGIIAGSGSKSPVDALTVDSSVITGNHANTAAPAATNKPGGGIQFIGGQLTITNSTISNNSAGSSVGAAVRYEAQGTASPQSFTMSNSKISGNTGANNTSSSLPIDGAVALAAPSSSTSMTVSRSAFTGNAMTGTSGPVRGAALTLQGGAMTVTGSSFSGNSVSGSGSAGGAIAVTADTASATITSDRIAGNQATSGATVTGIYNLGGSVQATDDWWGCNAGPGNAGCDTVSSGVTTTPNLVLSGPAQAVTVTPTGTAPITADVDHDSTGQAVGPEYGLDGDAATFSDPQPSGTSCTPGSVTFSGGTASATCTYAANGQAGSGHVVVTVDGQSITVPVTISGPPTISTQPQDTTVAPGATATFTAAATGAPAPTVQWQVSTDGGTSYQNITGATSTTYSFTAAAADSGNKYRAVFTNTNGSATTDPATLTVQQAPAITSADHTTFTAGTAGTFTITTTGTPDATVSESGTLPTGVTFTAGANGTATLSGTPAAGTGGSYPVTLTAHNGVSPDATQNFTLTINEAPAITTQPKDATVAPGATATFTAAATGAPAPTVQWQVSTDGGSTWANISGATSTTYSFTATTTDNGHQYRAVFTNSAGSATTSAATLTVQQAPAFTSADHATFTVGTSGSFTITTSGTPDATVSESGALPDGLTFTAGSHGTATLSGTPAAGTGGNYSITFTASNGVSPDATQNFTLTVNEAPAITTQPHDTSVAPGGTATFTAAATGAPAPTVQWQVSTDGGSTWANVSGATSTTYSFTATESDTGHQYRAVFTDTAGSATTSAATLTVQQAPAITSADHATFTVGTAGTFTITTTGTPGATVSESGTLPQGVTFSAGANGTATLSGNPAAGTGGSYPVTLTAHNGVSPDATQNFTLTINEAPAITSADSTSFGSGATGTFTVTTSGNPHPSLSETGDLPSGVTFTDNGDGTATLKGSTTASGTYHLSITASSSAGTANQAFTLTIDTAAQTITFTSSPPAGAVVGQDYTVTATGGGSGNPVTFTIDDTSSGVCTISGSTVTFNHPGACLIDAAQDGSTRYAPATASQTVPVSQAATTTTVTIHPSTVSAAVTVDSPGAGTPTGTVAFSVNGQPVGTASVSGGVATLNYRVPKGKNQNVAAVYSGDSDFSGSSGSTSRQYLGITATVSSSTPKTSYDWYRSPVTITFHCTTGKAPLTSPCPSPVTLSQNGAGQSVTRTIFATNGKVASVTVRNINIDTIAPQVSVDNVKNGATYHGTAPTPACHGRDTLSGIASCRLATSTAGDTVTVTATATDFAGNVSTATVSYTVVAAHRVTAP
jgi:P pilus assembly chaperone PapD